MACKNTRCASDSCACRCLLVPRRRSYKLHRVGAPSGATRYFERTLLCLAYLYEDSVESISMLH